MTQSFFINPARKRKLVVFGAKNPRRRRKGKNPPTRVSFPAHTETLFRVGKTGRWGALKRKKKAGSRRKGVTPKHLKKYLFKKRRSSPVSKESSMKRKKSRRARRARSHRRNPVPLGLNPRRRRSRRGKFTARKRSGGFRRNPGVISKLGLPPVKEMAFLAAGAIAARIAVPRVLLMLPMLSGNGYVRAVSRVALVSVASLIAQKALGANARGFIYGAIANQLPEAVNDVAAQFGVKLGLEEPENELSMYTMSLGAIEDRSGPDLGIYTDPNALSADEVPVG